MKRISPIIISILLVVCAAGCTKSRDDIALVGEMLAQVEVSQLSATIGDLSGEWPVTIGGEQVTLTSRVAMKSEAIGQATQYVYEQLQGLGLEVSYFDWKYEGGPVKRGSNVIAELRGVSRPDEIVLLTAHVDDMVNQDVNSAGVKQPRLPIPGPNTMWYTLPAPGADDNASGTAGVMLAARILSRYQFERTVRFVIFGGEENGYLGSYAYAHALAEAGENVVAVYNLDMIGYDAAGEPNMGIYLRPPEIAPEDTELANVVINVIETYQLDLVPVLNYQENGKFSGSDHGKFWEQGFAALCLAEDFANDENPYYHSQYEKLEYLNMEYLTNIVKAAVGATAVVARPVGKR